MNRDLFQTLDNYLLTDQQQQFRQQVQEFFRSQNFWNILKNSQLEKNDEIDPRRIYKLIAEHGLLAVHWPQSFGGQGKTMVELAILVEEMINAEIPETLFILSILFVGGLILLLDDSQQKEKWLPEMAAGNCFVSILYSESGAGSDLAALKTRATKINDEEYEITGRKLYSLKSQFCDYGLCAVRTRESDSKYDGITLILIPLRAEGVCIKPIPSMTKEVFQEVIFEKVKVSEKNIVGKLNEGWLAISKALWFERTGLDYVLKINQLLSILTHCLEHQSLPNQAEIINQLLYFGVKRDAVRIMSYSLLNQYQKDKAIDETKASMAKWYASELAMQIIQFGIENLDFFKLSQQSTVALDAFAMAYRDIPGTRLSAGSSEMMLEMIAGLQFKKIG
jgi:alkylation response protein AidB-like acyl-CoA dehydrogenase